MIRRQLPGLITIGVVVLLILIDTLLTGVGVTAKFDS